MTRAVLLAAALAAVAHAAHAQADTTASPSDTTPADTLPKLFDLPPVPVPQGPLPHGTRYTFTSDSLVFSITKTLADLLSRVPGVFVARGGLYGQTEVVLYGGRGPAALEVYWDGVPYLPIGGDSVYLDPARIPLAPLERVDVVLLPATLRVYLVTWRQSSSATTSEIGITTGQLNVSEYRGAFLKRWRSGVGLSAVADWNDIGGVTGTTSTPFHSVDLWVQADYLPQANMGASFQILSTDWHRTGDSLSLVNPRSSKRVDEMLRLFVGGRPDGRGSRLDLTLATAAVTNDPTVDKRTLTQGSLTASTAGRRAAAAVIARYGPEPAPRQVEVQASWNVARPITIAGDARHSEYTDSRKGDRAHVALGIILPFGFSAHGDAVWTRDLGAPNVPSDTVQRVTDVEGGIRLDRSWVTLDVGGGRRGEFTPADVPLPDLTGLSALGPTPPTNYLTAYGGLRFLPGLTIAGWYFDPIRGGGDFEPPRHGRLSLTFHSKFWRVYRSGIFALRLEGAFESWSGGGTAGFVRDSVTGIATVVGLAPATFVDIDAQIRIAGVTIFWQARNARAFNGGYVPGADYPRNFQYYGVRWRFTN